MLRRLALLSAFLLLGAAVLSRGAVAQQPTGAQPTVELRRPGLGDLPRIVGAALAAPHDVIVPTGRRANLLRDSVALRTVIVLGIGANIASTVHGSVIVIGGDAFLHPGAQVDGDVVAIGGAVYNSLLAHVSGRMLSFRDVTYDITPVAGGYALDYRVLEGVQSTPLLTLPLAYGFRLPEYNRVDGLVLPFGPRINLDTGRITIDPLVVYHSDLGKIDPDVTARARFGGGWWGELRGARLTASNDRWIYSDLLNSASALIRGRDYRNYYRAELARARAGLDWERETVRGSVWVGAQTERASSANAGGPWSLLHPRSVEDGMRRPNPKVLAGRTSSALAGVRAEWTLPTGVELTAGLVSELPVDDPGSGSFTQHTLDASVSFPTFGTQTLQVETHDVLSTGHAPPQRYAYLGGSGTLPTFPVLGEGGDRLLFVESRYNIPVERIRIPLVGSPVVTLRHMLGAAGVGKLPDLEQNLGLRLTVRPLRLDFVVDPVHRDTQFSAGVTLGR